MSAHPQDPDTGDTLREALAALEDASEQVGNVEVSEDPPEMIAQARAQQSYARDRVIALLSRVLQEGSRERDNAVLSGALGDSLSDAKARGGPVTMSHAFARALLRVLDTGTAPTPGDEEADGRCPKSGAHVGSRCWLYAGHGGECWFGRGGVEVARSSSGETP